MNSERKLTFADLCEPLSGLTLEDKLAFYTTGDTHALACCLPGESGRIIVEYRLTRRQTHESPEEYQSVYYVYMGWGKTESELHSGEGTEEEAETWLTDFYKGFASIEDLLSYVKKNNGSVEDACTLLLDLELVDEQNEEALVKLIGDFWRS